jgi:hypothetical protein
VQARGRLLRGIAAEVNRAAQCAKGLSIRQLSCLAALLPFALNANDSTQRLCRQADTVLGEALRWLFGGGIAVGARVGVCGGYLCFVELVKYTGQGSSRQAAVWPETAAISYQQPVSH